jgi:hypothetical protein
MEQAIKLLKAQIDPQTKTRIKDLHYSEDFEATVNDYAGGNIDDAYFAGVEDGNTIARWELAQELLELLVRACNAHDELVAALTNLLEDASRVAGEVCSRAEGHEIYTGSQHIIDAANAALRKARGEA